ncbi:MAG: spore cortex biosynthesis protein YabQ [Clostridiales bacterium]|jgi:hypothetical protein|nr:spore cortex biosynthesis protein YabQ [Clostridiales bacterium]
MPVNTNGQGSAFLICLAFGVAIGTVYEIGYIARFCGKFRLIVSVVADLLFFAAATLLVITGIRLADDGSIRAYSLLAFALGFCAERLTLGFLVAKCTNWVYNTLIKIYRALKKVKVFSKLLK